MRAKRLETVGHVPSSIDTQLLIRAFHTGRGAAGGVIQAFSRATPAMFRLVMVEQSFDIGVVRPVARRAGGVKRDRPADHTTAHSPQQIIQPNIVAVLAVQDRLALAVLWPVVKLQTVGTSPRSHLVAPLGGCATNS